MADFTYTINAAVSGSHVRVADLVRFEFLSQEVRLWSGFAPLLDNNNETWTGVGKMGVISGVVAGPGQGVEEMTFSLFGDDDMMDKFTLSVDETIGREVHVYQQFFDVRRFDESGAWVDWKPLDLPTQIFWGTMGPLIVDIPFQEVGETEPRLQVVSVKASNAFLNRRRPSFGFYSHRDQVARSSGNTDQMFVNASRMASVTVRWPKFA